MTVLKEIKSHPYVVGYLKELPFYNKHIKKTRVKRLKSIDLLSELPFLCRIKCNKNKSCI